MVEVCTINWLVASSGEEPREYRQRYLMKIRYVDSSMTFPLSDEPHPFAALGLLVGLEHAGDDSSKSMLTY